MNDLGEFPSFADGDVTISTADGRVWKLHSFFLRRNSSLFERLIANAQPIILTKKMRDERKTVLYRFTMEVLAENSRVAIFTLKACTHARIRIKQDRILISEVGSEYESWIPDSTKYQRSWW
jgi:hypothetical protein